MRFALTFLIYFSLQHAQAFTLNLQGLHGWSNKYLTVAVNYASCPISRDVLEDAIDQSFEIWNSVSTSNMQLVRGGNSATTAAQAVAGTASDSPVIICDTSLTATMGADSENSRGYTVLQQNSGTIVYGYILINAETGKSASVQNLTAQELTIGLSHEVGHLLGLGHSADVTSLMHHDLSVKNHMRLSQDDIDGVTYLYTRVEPDEDKVFGCASVGPARPWTNSFFYLLILTSFLVAVLKRHLETSQNESTRVG